MKIGVVTVIPTPYRDAYWGALAREPGIDLHVFYCAVAKDDRPWEITWPMDFPHTVLPGINILRKLGPDASLFWNRGLPRALCRAGCDALLVAGYNHVTMLQAIRFARRHHMPWYMMCESYYHPAASAVKRMFKEYFLKRLLASSAGGLPTGRQAAAYLQRYGCDHHFLLPNVPDLVRLREQVDAARDGREDFKRTQGIHARRVILFAGRLIPRKRVRLLIEAFAAAPLDDTQLVILGDGPERAGLEGCVHKHGLGERVLFGGFVQPEMMPDWYAAADGFVLPSSETWGVVAVEAIAAGLPTIVTDHVGCHPDVMLGPDCGVVIPLDDVQALQAALVSFISLSREAVDAAAAPGLMRMEMCELAAGLPRYLSTSLTM
jgi:glycosyltransferase involved in cell wall biosynthesis